MEVSTLRVDVGHFITLRLKGLMYLSLFESFLKYKYFLKLKIYKYFKKEFFNVIRSKKDFYR
jgi:hypothetical protein